MKVTLLAHTPEPEKTVACAAKLCYSSSSVDSLYDGLTKEKTDSFVEMLSEIGHESPIEHVSFTFCDRGNLPCVQSSAGAASHCFLQPEKPAVCQRGAV